MSIPIYVSYSSMFTVVIEKHTNAVFLNISHIFLHGKDIFHLFVNMNNYMIFY